MDELDFKLRILLNLCLFSRLREETLVLRALQFCCWLYSTMGTSWISNVPSVEYFAIWISDFLQYGVHKKRHIWTLSCLAPCFSSQALGIFSWRPWSRRQKQFHLRCRRFGLRCNTCRTLFRQSAHKGHFRLCLLHEEVWGIFRFPSVLDDHIVCRNSVACGSR